jgi:hypothetical protein
MRSPEARRLGRSQGRAFPTLSKRRFKYVARLWPARHQEHGQHRFRSRRPGYPSFSLRCLRRCRSRPCSPKMLRGHFAAGGWFTPLRDRSRARLFRCGSLLPRSGADARRRCSPARKPRSRPHIDVFNAGLYGAFAVIESARAEVIRLARAATSDPPSRDRRHNELDLLEQKAWSQMRHHVAKEAGFLYAASGKTTLDTPIDEPTNRARCHRRRTVPCDALGRPGQAATVYDCLMNKCSTEPGKDTGSRRRRQVLPRPAARLRWRPSFRQRLRETVLQLHHSERYFV